MTTREATRILLCLSWIALPAAALAQTGPPAFDVNVVNDANDPVPVTLEPGANVGVEGDVNVVGSVSVEPGAEPIRVVADGERIGEGLNVVGFGGVKGSCDITFEPFPGEEPIPDGMDLLIEYVSVEAGFDDFADGAEVPPFYAGRVAASMDSTGPSDPTIELGLLDRFGTPESHPAEIQYKLGKNVNFFLKEGLPKLIVEFSLPLPVPEEGQSLSTNCRGTFFGRLVAEAGG
jgi:hypothetical protein